MNGAAASVVLGDATQAIVIAIALLAVAVFVAFAYFFITFFGLWLKSLQANAGIALGDLVGMYLRRQKGKPHHYRQLTHSRIAAAQACLPVTLAELERHHLAGGDVNRVVNAMIVARQSAVPLSFAEAAACDLAGRDPLQALPAQED